MFCMEQMAGKMVVKMTGMVAMMMVLQVQKEWGRVEETYKAERNHSSTSTVARNVN